MLMTFDQYANLPGILNERLFKIMDENSDEYIDQKEFMRAMFKIYYSQLESKFKLIFEMYLYFYCYQFGRYDFDQDGFISQEDIHLVLSHVPIEVCLFSINFDNTKKQLITKSKGGSEEGSYTQEGGSQ